MHDVDSEGDVGGRTATREVGDGMGEALENGAGDGKTADLFEGFVESIAGIEVRSDEDVGVTGDRRGGSFFGGNSGINGGVELHFSINDNIGVREVG